MNSLSYSKFQQRLQYLMEDYNISQVDLCRRTGVSTASMSRYLHYERFPDFDNLIRLAEFFSVSIDWLLGRDDHIIQIDVPDRKMVALYSAASPDDRHVIDVILRKYDKE